MELGTWLLTRLSSLVQPRDGIRKSRCTLRDLDLTVPGRKTTRKSSLVSILQIFHFADTLLVLKLPPDIMNEPHTQAAKDVFELVSLFLCV